MKFLNDLKSNKNFKNSILKAQFECVITIT